MAKGFAPDALEAACRSTRARVLYCMPRLHNPTSAVMSERRRRQIAAIAEKYRLTVIEDDVYGFLSPERASLSALIPDRTIFVTSVSKSLFPGMRLGCAVAPPAMVEKLSARRLDDDHLRAADQRGPVVRLDGGWHRHAHSGMEAP